MAVRSRKIHDVEPREFLDRAAFILAFVLGICGGVFLKLIGAHAIVAASYAALILVAYAFAAWVGGRIKIEPESIGDNCYYLGFLFTLASLAFTLYQMADPSGTGGKPIAIPTVISGFGVALSSTIVGVFLRVLLMQMRPDFVAKDRAVRADLNRSYSDFRKDLSGTLSQMKAFSTESIQLASERDERLRVGTEKFVVDHHKALRDAGDALSKNMEASFSEAAKKALQEISAEVAKTNAQTHTALQRLLEDTQALSQRLNEQEASIFEELQSRRERLAKSFDASEELVKNHDVAMAAYLKSTRKAADAMSKRVVPALDAFSTRLEKLALDAEFEDGETKLDTEGADPISVKVKSVGPWSRKRTHK